MMPAGAISVAVQYAPRSYCLPQGIQATLHIRHDREHIVPYQQVFLNLLKQYSTMFIRV